MQATIKKKTYDTSDATYIGHRYAGEYGQADGFEERLFVASDGQHLLYGIGGADSPYSEPEIKLLSNEEAETWKQENNVE